MATYASTVARNENICILTGEGIGSATPDLQKLEKEDCKDTKALADLSKPAKHLESEEVEASSLKRKSSQQGTETTKRAKTSNTMTDEEIGRPLLWDEMCCQNHEICMEMEKKHHENAFFNLNGWSYMGGPKTTAEEMHALLLDLVYYDSSSEEGSLDSPGVPLEDDDEDPSCGKIS